MATAASQGLRTYDVLAHDASMIWLSASLIRMR